MRSPTGSWIVSAPSVTLVPSPAAAPTIQTNGTRVASPPPNGRVARQDKKRLSLSFFKSNTAAEPQELQKPAAHSAEVEIDAVSTAASSRSRSKDTGKHRLSFLNSGGGPEAVPAPPLAPPPPAVPVQQQVAKQKQQVFVSEKGRVSLDVEASRPKTSKSETNEDQRSLGGSSRKGSVRKRLSLLHIGKKGGKGSGKRSGGVDTLVEE